MKKSAIALLLLAALLLTACSAPPEAIPAPETGTPAPR